MRGTFGLGKFLKKGLSQKDNKKLKNTKKNLTSLNSPEIQNLQEEKDKLLVEENKILEKIDSVNVDSIKLKNQLNELQIKKKKFRASTLVTELKDYKNRLNNESNKEKDEKNINKLNRLHPYYLVYDRKRRGKRTRKKSSFYFVPRSRRLTGSTARGETLKKRRRSVRGC